MNASIEQVLKRLEDMLKLQSAILEQLSELGWITKDVIEDLVLALHDDSLPKEAKEATEGVRGNP